MKLFIHDGNIITAHGNLDSTWSALLDLKKPGPKRMDWLQQPLPLASVPNIQGEFGSHSRLNSLLTKLHMTIPELPADTELICSTTKAAVDHLFYDNHPQKGQVWHVAEEVRDLLGIKKKGSCISAACASGTIAIIQGAMKILTGQCTHALIIGFDVMSKFIIGGFASLKALSPSGCKPFDKNRDGLTLGEGAGWLLLSKDCAPFSSGNRYFFLDRWGISCDATHITAPCRKATGLMRTLGQISKEKKDYPGGINAHGTGTPYNDAMELLAFTNVYTTPPPICSIKGSVGHCLGAAGVIEALISLKSLEKGHLPPTVGLAVIEDKAEGICSGQDVLQLTKPSVLSCNSGFGGINSAVLFAEELNQ